MNNIGFNDDNDDNEEFKKQLCFYQSINIRHQCYYRLIRTPYWGLINKNVLNETEQILNKMGNNVNRFTIRTALNSGK